jgi:hypothetical protein
VRQNDLRSRDVDSSAISTIIPTLDGRVRGELWSGNSTQQTDKKAGLIVLLDDSDPAASLHQVVANLACSCQMAGISVLEIFYKRAPQDARAANPNRLALDVLAAVTHLRNDGTTDVAVLLDLGTHSRVPVHRLETLLFSQFLAAGMGASATWQDTAPHLAMLTDTVRWVVDSIRGVASIQVLLDETLSLLPLPEKPDGAASVPDVATASASPEEGRRGNRILYDWTLATLQPRTTQMSAVSPPSVARTAPRRQPCLDLLRATPRRGRLATYFG